MLELTDKEQRDLPKDQKLNIGIYLSPEQLLVKAVGKFCETPEELWQVLTEFQLRHIEKLPEEQQSNETVAQYLARGKTIKKIGLKKKAKLKLPPIEDLFDDLGL